MRLRMSVLIGMCLLILHMCVLPLLAAEPQPAQDQNQTQTLEQIQAQVFDVTTRYFDAINAEDLETVVTVFHTESHIFKSVIDSTKKVFEDYDTTQELIGTAFIGFDGEYAYVRAQTKTRFSQGDDVVNIATQDLLSFKQELGKWKIWVYQELSRKFL